MSDSPNHENLEKFADELTQQLEARKRAEEEKEEERLRITIERIEKQKNAGLPYAKKIFDWANNFKKAPVAKKLFKIGTIYGDGSGVCFFNGQAFQTTRRCLGIDDDGIWWMGFGCGSHPRIAETPEDLAKNVEPATLELVCQWIDHGKVWECIKETMIQRYDRR